MNKILCCPICKNELYVSGKSYICTNGHNYDLAKEGYVNLLSPNQKKSKMPGDNKDMLLARKDFLNSGTYNKLLSKIIEIISSQITDGSVVVEAGCGEGYYISGIKQAFPNNECYGFDISKDAVKMACKRNNLVNLYVSSSYSSNIKDKSVDVLIVIFAPFAEDEFERILANNGICIVVKPNSDHLIQLKEQFYEKIKPLAEGKYKKFKVTKADTLSYKFAPSDEELHNLFKMTPFYYRVNEEKRRNLIKNNKKNEINADFLIEVLKK